MNVYTRRGIGSFKVELKPRGREGSVSADEYSAAEWPKLPLMSPIEGCERQYDSTWSWCRMCQRPLIPAIHAFPLVFI